MTIKSFIILILLKRLFILFTSFILSSLFLNSLKLFLVEFILILSSFSSLSVSLSLLLYKSILFIFSYKTESKEMLKLFSIFIEKFVLPIISFNFNIK